MAKAVGTDDEVINYVRRLEFESDARVETSIDGDELASEIEEFLRNESDD